MQGEPLLVRSLLPPAALLHHVRRRFFSGGSDRRARQQAQHAQRARQAEEEDEEQPAAAASPGLSQEQDAAGSGDLASDGELRRGYLRLACTIVSESAAAADRGGAAAGAASGSNRQAGPISAAAASDEGLGADLQAMLSLASDCCISIAAGGSGAAADAQLLQELLSLLLLPLLKRDSLARLPLLRHLQQLGGPALLLPLLQLEQQQLRLLGLRALAAALAGSSISGGTASTAASRVGGRADSAASRRRSVGSPPLPQQLLPAAAEEEEVVLAAGKLLSAFPLTAATRIALVELLCDAVPWPQVRLHCTCFGHKSGHAWPGWHACCAAAVFALHVHGGVCCLLTPALLFLPLHSSQIDALAPPGPPATAVAGEWDATGASAAHVRVRHPGAAALLLRTACEPGTSAAERAAVLQLLLLLCTSASLSQQAQQGNQDQLLAAPTAWQQHLLDCISLAAGSGSSAAGEAAVQEAAAADAAWRLLVLLLARGIAASPAGWQQLQATVSLLKAQPGRTYLAPDYSARGSTSGGTPVLQLVPTDSWHLLQALLADVVSDLLAAQAADAATAAGTAGSSGAAVSSPTVGARGPRARRTSSDWDAWTLVSQVGWWVDRIVRLQAVLDGTHWFHQPPI